MLQPSPEYVHLINCFSSGFAIGKAARCKGTILIYRHGKEFIRASRLPYDREESFLHIRHYDRNYTAGTKSS